MRSLSLDADPQRGLYHDRSLSALTGSVILPAARLDIPPMSWISHVGLLSISNSKMSKACAAKRSENGGLWWLLEYQALESLQKVPFARERSAPRPWTVRGIAHPRSVSKACSLAGQHELTDVDRGRSRQYEHCPVSI